jgi:hypothetical protein
VNDSEQKSTTASRKRNQGGKFLESIKEQFNFQKGRENVKLRRHLLRLLDRIIMAEGVARHSNE